MPLLQCQYCLISHFWNLILKFSRCLFSKFFSCKKKFFLFNYSHLFSSTFCLFSLVNLWSTNKVTPSANNSVGTCIPTLFSPPLLPPPPDMHKVEPFSRLRISLMLLSICTYGQFTHVGNAKWYVMGSNKRALHCALIAILMFFVYITTKK